jgi:hypothetical protein
MALGGGNIKTTTFPGTYINFVSTNNASTIGVGERGVVAICHALPTVTDTAVVECTSEQFYGAANPLKTSFTEDSMWMFREIFKHAQKVVVYNLTNEGATLADGLTALEAYEFNVLVTASMEASDVTAVVTRVKNWRDNIGKKCQAVVYNHSVSGDLNTVATINVAAKPVLEEGDTQHTEAALVYWVAGAMAGCEINKSCTNMMYDGELTVNVAYSQADLQAALDAGKIIFHLVYGEVRMLEDVNSLVTPDADQNEDFKYNQTIRIIDQIANDIAYIFNTKYLGIIPNDASGRISLWNDIVTHHTELETMRAIENFDPEALVVSEGDNIRSVVVQDVIQIVGTMSQLFMTVVIA